jgi:hypothetical protein
VLGDIQTPVLVIHEGAVFEGNCHTSVQDAKNDKDPEIIELVDPVDENNQPLGKIHGIVMADTPNPDAGSGPHKDFGMEPGKRAPLKNAKIIAVCKGEGKRRTETNHEGYYEIDELGDGTWTVTVKAKGYEHVASTVEISGGGVYELNF